MSDHPSSGKANDAPGQHSASQPAQPLPSTSNTQAQGIAFTDPPHQSITESPTTALQPRTRGNTVGASASTPAIATEAGEQGKSKKKKHRNKKRRNRRQSFAAPAEDTAGEMTDPMERPNLLQSGIGRTRSEQERERQSFYRVESGTRSSESLESEALLDHRDQGPLQTRRQSIQGGLQSQRMNQSQPRRFGQRHNTLAHVPEGTSRSRLSRTFRFEEDDDVAYNDISPLIRATHGRGTPGGSGTPREYGTTLGSSFQGRPGPRRGRKSRDSSHSSRRKHDTIFERHQSSDSAHSYDINNPPSMPGSPVLGPDMGYDDVMLTSHEIAHSRSPENRRLNGSRDALIDIDEPEQSVDSRPTSPGEQTGTSFRHRQSLHPAEGDVCFPQEGMSEIGEEDYTRFSEADTLRRRRRRGKKWPDLSYLEEWSVLEKEERTLGGIRSRKVSEPLLVGGRLRPQKTVWHREEDDAPYRFTYFNEEFQSTIHAQTISELLQDGQTFKDLFIPEPPVLDDSSSDEDDEYPAKRTSPPDEASLRQQLSPTTTNQARSRQHSIQQVPTQSSSKAPSVRGKVTPPTAPEEAVQTETPSRTATPTPQQPRMKPKRYGPRPVFWLDILSPSDAEMRVISKAFGIHPLTAEDIMMQEAREKVELFRNYYFVNYRTFEQDSNSENYLEPVNMYVVVFRDGVLSFHFSQTPHPANVRRRIRQLTDYLILTSDWISYAIIDDITDVYAPLIQRIEDEVDEIDAEILGLHDGEKNSEDSPYYSQATSKPKKWRNTYIARLLLPNAKDSGYQRLQQDDDSGKGEKNPDDSTGDGGGNMLRRTGECRKKVMSLYRLLGNKADVIKGFAKRCNEQWDVAPRSEIGLYLGDIQDHIVTMTANLSHYENLLSRAHSNYLAQINIRMNERAEKTNDILGKLTVVGTIVLPMNIITGLWGMNCLVPGQEGEHDEDNLNWFWSITAGLVMFALISFTVAKNIYKIV